MEYIIYIHHFFSKSLFYKLAHNTTDRVFNIDDDNTGFVTTKYKGNNIKFIFNPIINYNEDGLHLVDFYTAFVQKHIDPTYKNIIKRNRITDVDFLTKVNEIICNQKNWIVLFLRMEKIVDKYEEKGNGYVSSLELNIEKLKNHKIISDNVFLQTLIKKHYPNHFFCLTNSIFQWNEYISIRWYYEYKNIFEKLIQPFDLCFSVRHHKLNRIQILDKLSKLNDDRIYLSRVDNCRHKTFNKYSDLFEKNIHNNITKSDNFDDTDIIENIGEYKYLDYLMRILPMAKMHILSESWDFKKGDYASIFLSEKTYGFLLAKIPFISTHPYPLDIINHILDVDLHPFYNEIKSVMGCPEKFGEFVKTFMADFDKNYKLCKDWVESVHIKLMEKINNENSLLDLVLNNFDENNQNKQIEKSLI
jgi:hypothetical protein